MEKTKLELPKKYSIGVVAENHVSGTSSERCNLLAKLVTAFISNDATVSEKDIGNSFRSGKKTIVSKPMIHSVAETKSLALMAFFNETHVPIESFIEVEE